MPDLVELRYPSTGARAVLQADARRLPAGWGQAMTAMAALYRTALAARTAVGHSGSPKGPKPGRAAAGWKVRSSGAGGAAVRTLYNTQPYLRWVLKGRAAIDQTKKTGPARHPLHFWIDGQEFYRWRVKAAPANNFIPTAMAAARRQAVRQLPALVRPIFARSLVPHL
jgi:hypothetical protein